MTTKTTAVTTYGYKSQSYIACLAYLHAQNVDTGTVFVLHQSMLMDTKAANVKVTVNASELGRHITTTTHFTWTHYCALPKLFLQTKMNKTLQIILLIIYLFIKIKKPYMIHPAFPLLFQLIHVVL
jgi:hypothetical protein